MTGRDRAGQLWVTPLTGPPGFLNVTSLTTLEVSAVLPAGDPLHGLPAGQQVGLVVVEFVGRQRVRVNGTLIQGGQGRLIIKVEQAYGNCPQYIQPRVLIPGNLDQAGDVRHGGALASEDIELIRGADTFFLGTTHPERGSDASHRGGPPGFVRRTPTSCGGPITPATTCSTAWAISPSTPKPPSCSSTSPPAARSSSPVPPRSSGANPAGPATMGTPVGASASPSSDSSPATYWLHGRPATPYPRNPELTG